MLRASALYYTIVISLLIGVLSAMLILYTRYSLMELSYYDSREQLIKNAESGMLLMYRASAKSYDKGSDISLTGDSKDSIYLRGYAWGIYRVGVSRAHQGRLEHVTTAFLGCLSGTSYANQALYLTDHQTALGFCGKAKIEGDAQLPKMGTKLNFVEGKTAESGSLVDGKVSISAGTVPTLDAEYKRTVEAQYGNESQLRDDTVIHWPISCRKLYRGYEGSTLRLELPANSILSDINLTGNIKIVAPQGIKIDSSAHLKGVLVICPKIELLEDFSGVMQLLASDTVIVRKNCTLQYPSSIYIREKPASQEATLVLLEDGARLQGEVYEMGSQNGRNEVVVDRDACVQGLIYAGNRLVLKGNVEGMVVSDKFYLKTATAIYEDQLLDGRINRKRLPREFLFSGLLMNGKDGMITHVTER